MLKNFRISSPNRGLDLRSAQGNSGGCGSFFEREHMLHGKESA